MRVNWEFSIKCVDCGSVFIVETVNSSVNRFDNGGRMALLTIPNECPDCHNLRVVKRAED